MSSVPVEYLEVKAAEQRRELHKSVQQLRGKIEDKLDVRSHAREYLVPAAGVFAVIGLAVGWGLTGIFTDLFQRK